MTVPTCKQLINGKWQESTSGNILPVTNPSTGETIAQVPLCDQSEVDKAVQAALAAFPAWAKTPPQARTQILFRYKHLLDAHFDELYRLVTREHGKTLAEAKGSVRRGIEVVDLACGIPMLIKGETLSETGGSVDYMSERFPLGVCAGITPFNFPAMIPLWMFPIALACGNTFILKPSEQTPLTAIRLVELLVEAGIPDGVMNLIHGARDAVNALLTHPHIRAISFVGSTPVARYIYQTGAANGKRVQSAGGAKNHFIVMPDAPVDAVIEAINASAFGCAGERCMAGSTLLTVPGATERILEPLREAAAAMKVGPTDSDESVDMGPVISKPHLEKIHGYLAQSEKEGAKLILDGRHVNVESAPNGYYIAPTLVDGVNPQSGIIKEEVFGPVLGILRMNSLDEAIEQMNQSPFGNAGVIFTDSGKAARQFRREVRCGMIGINVGVPAPMASFSFTGWNDSFFGDLHIQGTEGIAFYTQQKVTITRWF
ncbi:MAG: CoA-acylating methylmalonate-semialdehyde dehydrogenase [Candidatus Omnitrophota bacterium]|jgi:malonate-semialdehyde dehydrogenase (acetylating)/methylmalonate-semialdehyde dehydrogenase|nr:MAG: CoA-acylating methylmalonate-semialdehyde dehydrogenase [Candidatus Omnitrophota bacterium]